MPVASSSALVADSMAGVKAVATAGLTAGLVAPPTYMPRATSWAATYADVLRITLATLPPGAVGGDLALYGAARPTAS